MSCAKMVFLLVLMLLLGCIPDELVDAGKNFSRENYHGAIRKIDSFLRNMGEKGADSQESQYQAISLFYRGISKRACLIYREIGKQSDYEESGRFRFGVSPTCEFSTREIVDDYMLAKSLLPDLMAADFHIGLEYVLAGQFQKALEHLTEFEEFVCSNAAIDVEMQFGNKHIFQTSVELADEIRHGILDALAISANVDFKEKVNLYYRNILFCKSRRHELHNIDILMRKYAVSQFGFLREFVDWESDYDYIEKNVECGMDYLILRGRSIDNGDRLLQVFEQNGFGGWTRYDTSRGVRIECRMGICIFEGDENIPIMLSMKKTSFARMLVAIYSYERNVLYCVVCKDNSLLFQQLTSSLGVGKL